MLSERERRELDVLGRALAADDPRLARLLCGADAESRATSAVVIIAIALAAVSGFALVTLGSSLHQGWVSALGAVLAASTPFVASWWIAKRHAPGR